MSMIDLASSKKTTRHNHGMTIIEILVVVAVIGVLAGMTTIWYGGMQKRARTAEAENAGLSVHKKAETAYSVTGQYPTAISGDTGFDRNPDSKLTGTGIILAHITDEPTNPQTVHYESCGYGARVSWWDYTARHTAQETLGEPCDTYTSVTNSP